MMAAPSTIPARLGRLATYSMLAVLGATMLMKAAPLRRLMASYNSPSSSEVTLYSFDHNPLTIWLNANLERWATQVPIFPMGVLSNGVVSQG